MASGRPLSIGEKFIINRCINISCLPVDFRNSKVLNKYGVAFNPVNARAMCRIFQRTPIGISQNHQGAYCSGTSRPQL